MTRKVLTQWTNQSNDEFSLQQESAEEGDDALPDVSEQSANYPEAMGSKIDEKHYFGHTTISQMQFIGSTADEGYSRTHSLD